MIEWLKLSFKWVFKDRKRYKNFIDNQQTQVSVNTFKKNEWLTRFKYHHNHWSYRDFKMMCYKRICLIEHASKDL